MRLPEHLEPLLTDEPVLDVYSYGPWRVPDGLFDEIATRIDGLAADPRAVELTTDEHKLLTLPASLVTAEIFGMLAFLPGGGAIKAGSWSQLPERLLHRHLVNPGPLSTRMTRWDAPGGRWRPPVDWLIGRRTGSWRSTWPATACRCWRASSRWRSAARRCCGCTTTRRHAT